MSWGPALVSTSGCGLAFVGPSDAPLFVPVPSLSPNKLPGDGEAGWEGGEFIPLICHVLFLPLRAGVLHVKNEDGVLEGCPHGICLRFGTLPGALSPPQRSHI